MVDLPVDPTRPRVVTGNAHVDFHAIWIAPGQPGRIYVGNDGGFYRTESGAGSWVKSVDLPITQFYAGSIDPSNPQLAASLAGAFNLWRRFPAQRRTLMRAALERIRRQPALSTDVAEVVGRALDG